MTKHPGFRRPILMLTMLPWLVLAEPTFQRTFGGSAEEYSYSGLGLAGGYILSGWTNSFGAGYSDRYLVRTDERGETLWTHTYGTRYGDEIGFSVVLAPDGGFVVCGYTVQQNWADVTLMKTDAGGNLLWDRRYGGSANDMAYAMDTTSDSGFILAGCTYSFGAGVPNVYVIRTDAEGDTLWTRVFGGSGEDYAFAVEATRDSGFVVCGWTTSFGAGGSDVYLIKLDAAGEVQWTRTFGGLQSEACHSIRQMPDDGFIMCAQTTSFGAGQCDFYLIRTDEQGETLWTRTYGGRGNDRGHQIELCRDGGFIMSGQTSSFGAGSEDAWLVKVDSSGDTLWTRTFGGPADDETHHVEQIADGGYMLVGTTSSFGAGLSDCWLIKTDSAGRVAIAEPQVPASPLPRVRATINSGSETGMVLYDALGRAVTSRRSSGIYFIRRNNKLAQVR